MAEGAPILRVEAVTKRFGGVTALERASLVVSAGQVVGVFGPNGSGKTTLLNVVGGFLRPDAGRVVLGAHMLTGRRPDAIARLGVARLFQRARLVSDLTVRANLLLALEHVPAGDALGGNAAMRRLRRRVEPAVGTMPAVQALGLVELLDQRAAELSYGQRKLVSVAMCLTLGSRLLMMDEPVAGLAPPTADIVLQTLRVAAANGAAVLIVEHDVAALSRTCDSLVFVVSGHPVLSGTPTAVLRDPAVLDTYVSAAAGA